MLGQKLSPEHLLPLALAHLERNPFVRGDMYLGDLLRNAMDLDAAFWRAHPSEARRMARVAKNALKRLNRRKTTGSTDAELRRLIHAAPWRAS